MTVIPAAMANLVGATGQATTLTTPGAESAQDFLQIVEALIGSGAGAAPSGLEKDAPGVTKPKAERKDDEPAEKKAQDSPENVPILTAILPQILPPTPRLVLSLDAPAAADGGKVVAEAAAGAVPTHEPLQEKNTPGSKFPAQPAGVLLAPQLALHAVIRAKSPEPPPGGSIPPAPSPRVPTRLETPATLPEAIEVSISSVSAGTSPELPRPTDTRAAGRATAATSPLASELTVTPPADGPRPQADQQHAHDHEAPDKTPLPDRTPLKVAVEAAPARSSNSDAAATEEQPPIDAPRITVPFQTPLAGPAVDGERARPAGLERSSDRSLPVRESVPVESVAPRSSAPLREISLRIPDTPTSNVDLHLIERGGRVIVDVRSSDPGLTQALRTHSDQLARQLDATGFKVEHLNAGEHVTAVRSTEMSGLDSGSEAGNKGGAQGGDRSPRQPLDQDGRQQRRSQQTWADYVDDKINEPIPQNSRRLQWPAR